MEITSLCLMLSATLSVRPDRSQFFRYEDIHLTCGVSQRSSKWTLRRNTSTKSYESFNEVFGPSNESSYILKEAYPSDSGVYWCEAEKECSNILNITVTAGSLILESPARPVAEGEYVTLTCSYRERYATISTSDFNATFFKSGVVFGTERGGKMILPYVTKSDEGFYKCKHPKYGESPESPLRVVTPPTKRPVVQHVLGPTTRAAGPPFMSLTRLLCIALVLILYTAIIAVCVYAYRKYTRARAERRVYEHLTMG